MRLHVVEAGPADGPLVLLLHGFPEFWYGWRRQVPALARAGYRVWAPDQRGYNLSDAPDAVARLRHRPAGGRRGGVDGRGRRPERAAVVGHDWGAVVAWWLALRERRDRVERLAVLNVPHPLAYKRFSGAVAAADGQELVRRLFPAPRAPRGHAPASLGAWSLRATSAPGTFSDADLARYRAAWARPGRARGMVSWYRALARRLAGLSLDEHDRPPADARSCGALTTRS